MTKHAAVPLWTDLDSATPAPSPNTMAGAECQALREIMLLTREQAAMWVGPEGATAVDWGAYETGAAPVPDGLASSLKALAACRQAMIDQAMHGTARGARIAIWYATADAWRCTHQPVGIAWRLHNSVVADLVARRLCRLINFDEMAYSKWAAGRPSVSAAQEASRHLTWARAAANS